MADGTKKTLTIRDVGKKSWEKPGSTQTWYTVATEESGEPVTFIRDSSKGAPIPEVGKRYTGNSYETDKGERFYAFGDKPQQSGGGKSPEVEENIARAVALKAAAGDKGVTLEEVPIVLSVSDKLLAWLQGKTEAVKEDIVYPDDGEPINLERNPFDE